MTYQAIAKYLARMHADLQRGDASGPATLAALRDHASQAGYLLLQDLRSNRLALPEPMPMWLEIAIQKPSGILLGWSTSTGGRVAQRFVNVDVLISCLADSQVTLDSTRSYSAQARNSEHFLSRHVFFEAVTSWLRDRYEKDLETISLPSLTLDPYNTERKEIQLQTGEIITLLPYEGRALSSVCDFLTVEHVEDASVMLVPLARVCLRACEVLEGECGSAHRSESVRSELEQLEENPCHRSGVSASQVGEPEIRHAQDFSWLIAANGERYDFLTGRQRDIVRALYNAWEAAGDGAPMTEAAIIEALAAPIERLRVARAFDGHPALGAILVCRSEVKATWALYLRKPLPREGSSQSHR